MLIRLGRQTDTEWITQLLQAGARDGHFAPTVFQQAPELIKTVLQNGSMTMMKLRGALIAFRKIDTQLWVADMGDQPASFLIALVDHEENETEIHLAATVHKFRRQGLFSSLVAHAKANNAEDHRLFARCYEKSSWAIEALLKLGFRKSKDGNPIELSS